MYFKEIKRKYNATIKMFIIGERENVDVPLAGSQQGSPILSVRG